MSAPKVDVLAVIREAHSQDLSDILGSARLRFCDGYNNIHSQMFRASFGRLFSGPRAHFSECIEAYDNNKHRVAEILSEIAIELELRDLPSGSFEFIGDLALLSEQRGEGSNLVDDVSVDPVNRAGGAA